MEEEELADLALSIAAVGLIQPLVVKRTGARFEVTAGHRRLLACRLAQHSPVKCIIKAASDVDPLAILVHENAHREAVNPVEEARFYQRVLGELCHNDVDELCIKIRRKREYVEDRLLLLQGHPEVVEALQQKRIGIGVARELNKVRDPLRLLVLLDVAKTQGATARQVAEWRTQGELMGPIGAAPAEDPRAGDAANGAPHSTGMVCLFCDDGDDPHLMEFIYLHRPCKKILLKMLNRIPDQQQQQS